MLESSAMNDPELIDAIDALLPQTQCQRCEYEGCRPYAEAIAAGDAINKCPPGGEATIAALARLLERPAVPLDRRHGEPGPRLVARIREAECIGCTKCIQACPTDAILGAAKQMHTVLETECTGCELCIAPCPVDCIDMVEPADGQTGITDRQSAYWRRRHEARNARLARWKEEKAARQRERLAARSAIGAESGAAPATVSKSRQDLQADIRAAVERTRKRKAAQRGE
ncbi:MAG: electron transport complex subunit RsxB [Pseudomonadota bacterium]